MNILAIETSCDETACAVVEDGTKTVSSVVASSTDMHKKYGGIVPEIAAREQLKCILPVLEESLAHFVHPSSHAPARQVSNNQHNPFTDYRKPHKNTSLHSNRLFLDEVWLREIIEKNIDAIAVTVGPGLIGSLLVGVETAKTIAFVTGKPIIPVNHVLAHVYANFAEVIPSEVEGSLAERQTSQPRLTVANASLNKLRDSSSTNRQTQNDKGVQFPAISLVVSGGHTELYLMTSMKDLTWLGGTLDDAAGECFDKSARLLGFGNGGGASIEAAASKCQMTNDQCQIKLPRPMIGDKSLNFSFSGLKTAILREANKFKDQKQFNNITTQQLAYEVQEAITDVLVEKTLRAAEIHNAKSILLSGGVAANTRLREKFLSKLQNYESSKLSFHVPPKELCTDNAVYIGSYAFFRGKPIDWHEVTAIPDLSVENL